MTTRLREEQENFFRRVVIGAWCARPGCPNRARRAHHVIYQQHIDKAGGWLWDPAIGLPLCDDCHQRHHGIRPLALACLTVENLDYAFALLGPAAYDYLRRRYVGADPRLESRLAAA